MREFKVGDYVMLTDSTLSGLTKDTFGTVIKTDLCSKELVYLVKSASTGVTGWVQQRDLLLVAGLAAEPTKQLDLHTVEVIYNYLTATIKTANQEGGSHEAVNIAILSYLVGMKEALNG